MQTKISNAFFLQLTGRFLNRNVIALNVNKIALTCSVMFLDAVKLINTAQATICQNQGPSFKLPLS